MHLSFISVAALTSVDDIYWSNGISWRQTKNKSKRLLSLRKAASSVNVSQICLQVQEELRWACSYFSPGVLFCLCVGVNMSLDEFCERWRYCCSCYYLQHASAYSVHNKSVTKKVITQSHLRVLAFPIFWTCLVPYHYVRSLKFKHIQSRGTIACLWYEHTYCHFNVWSANEISILIKRP